MAPSPTMRPGPTSTLLACVVVAIFSGWALGVPVRNLKLNATEEFIVGHNRARAAVHVGPLTWSPKLAREASQLARYQKDKEGCKFANLTTSLYGANQAIGGGPEMGPRRAVELWVSEKPFYNHTNNTCASGHQCNVYTQVVWKKTLKLGCALAKCIKGDINLIICLYFPPGNIIGERPY